MFILLEIQSLIVLHQVDDNDDATWYKGWGLADESSNRALLINLTKDSIINLHHITS